MQVFYMVIKMLIVVLCLLSTSWAVATAANETIELGPVSISLELDRLGSFSLEKAETYSMVHKKPDFQYDITSASINMQASHLVQIEVHQMSMSEPLNSPISKEEPGKNYLQTLTAYLPDSVTNKEPPRREDISGLEHCMEMSKIIPVGEHIQTESYTIDGQQGLIATINSDPKKPRYFVAYSPDEQSGSGTIVCIIGSDLQWEETERLFNSLQISI